MTIEDRIRQLRAQAATGRRLAPQLFNLTDRGRLLAFAEDLEEMAQKLEEKARRG